MKKASNISQRILNVKYEEHDFDYFVTSVQDQMSMTVYLTLIQSVGC